MQIVDSTVVEDLEEVEVDYKSAGDDHQTAGGFVLRASNDRG